jgi:hypothetical protein
MVVAAIFNGANIMVIIYACPFVFCWGLVQRGMYPSQRFFMALGCAPFFFFFSFFLFFLSYVLLLFLFSCFFFTRPCLGVLCVSPLLLLLDRQSPPRASATTIATTTGTAAHRPAPLRPPPLLRAAPPLTTSPIGSRPLRPQVLCWPVVSRQVHLSHRAQGGGRLGRTATVERSVRRRHRPHTVRQYIPLLSHRT